MDGLCCLLSYPCRKVKLTATADQHGLLELDRSQLVQTELLNTGNFDDGVCAQEEPIFIVMKYMAHGYLLNYLQDGLVSI
ncbi:unnamed protein product [Rotaria sp. Silwood1]|nr:unnamed protein product [Rotaria sp. Silwood1]CAF4624971.1 unnamed protein product [Rotaria sp. Silwood1]CAF4742072.1 unnamed protein product [Rotaria sp. Silwood1]